MFWADKAADEIAKKLKDKIASGEKIVVRDEKTVSGHPHVGSLVGVALHDMITRVLQERGIHAKFYYELNDTDAMDGLPNYLDEALYGEHMGKQLRSVPAPDDSADSLGKYFGKDFERVITQSGYTPEIYMTSSLYDSGKMNNVIRLALKRADVIRKIYKEVSGSDKPDDWLPLYVTCPQCGKLGTTQVTSFDGENVTYTCQENTVDWAAGCGHEGTVSPFDGNATLPWKVEWAAKFAVMNVAVEGAGKDHSTKGGARDVADRIAKEVFEFEPPFNIPYEFFLVGGKKMSSSKGNAITAREIADLLPPHILTLALVGRDIKRQTNFDPTGDSIPLLFDQYDRFAAKYWSGKKDDDARAFMLCHTPHERPLLEERFLPRFSQIAFLVQMPHMNVEEEVALMKGSKLNDTDREEVALRSRYAREWLKGYADEKFIFELQKTIPESAAHLSDEEKRALTLLGEKVAALDTLDGQTLHELTHEVKEESGLTPQQFFSAIYTVFLGKTSGPKVGWFLSTLEKDFVVNRLALK